MQINRCWNCMEDLGERDCCPNCGFDPEKQENAAFALRPNTILHGKYLVGNVLGQGGYGITYIGLDLALELKVAIKEYYPAGKAMRNNEKGNALYWRKSDSPEESWRNGCIQFLSEARKMARINSIPEIVSVRDTFEENNTAYIVMDYVPGMTMKEYLKKNGLLTFEECVKLLSPVIDGLDKVHRQGLIHRDISPDNLMLTPEKKVYLLDLGAAKDMKDKIGGDVSASKRGFSPIEQDTSTGSIGPWTDVYALAATIYYCVYGKLIPSSMKRYEQDTLSFSGKAKKPLTNKQIAVLKKALAIQQEGRYQSVKEMLTALQEACESKKKKGGKLVAAIAGIAAVAAAAAMLIVNKPWLPEVVEYGSSGPYFSANFVAVEDKFEYFTDLDNALVRVPYNEEDETFYLDTAEVIYEQNDAHVDDVIGGLNLSEDKLYATYYGGRDSEGVLHEGYLLSMNHDGTDLQQLQVIPYEATSTQYIKLSNGEEYLYYLMDDGSEEGAYHLYLYRFNLQTMTQEQLREGEVQWYGLYKKCLYYTVWDEDAGKYLLYRATTDGKGGKLVDDVHNFWNGVVVDDRLYLVQLTDAKGVYSVGLVQCGEDGKPIEEGTGIFGVDWTNATWTVGGGWVYYNESGSDELNRIRLDGTEKQCIYSGYQYHNLSYHNSRLYFQDGTMEGETFHPYQAYIAASDGSWIAQCGFAMDYLTDEQGVRYVIEDDQAKAVGYVGTEEDVILPLEFNGYPFNDDVKWEEFVSENVPITDLHFYALMEESELTYTKDASGITITGYSGMKTGDISQVAIPTEIDGVPVDQSVYESLTDKYIKNSTVTTETTEAGTVSINGTVGEDGILRFEGLKAGTYTITELRAPDGYNILDDELTITVSFDEETSTFTYGNAVDSDGAARITIVNQVGTELPSTGGIGTTVFYIVGGILVLAAIVLLVTKKRMAVK